MIPLLPRRVTAIAVLFIIAPLLPVWAAVSQGPVCTNDAAALQRRNIQFYDAEQSYQEKLKVGRERYSQKQAVRAKVIAAMQEELRAREVSVVMHPMDAPSPRIYDPAERSRTLPKALVIVALLAFIYYNKRLKSNLKPSSIDRPYRRKRSGFLGLRPFRARYRVIALKPVIILANVPVSKAKDRPAWIELKAGENRDKLGRVHGVHPDFVPHGRRMYMDGIDPDVVPLGTWTDGELPKNFYDYFRMELSE